MHIRRLLSGDLREVIDLESCLSSGWSEMMVQKELLRPSGLQLVACGNPARNVIGWCCGLWVEEEAELLRIVVTPAERKSGVASALLGQFEKNCTERNVASIFLEVASGNEAARRLYAKFGYRQIGKRKKYYNKPPDDALVLKKMFP